MERTIHCGESCGIQQLQNKDGVKDKDIPREYVEEVYCQRARSGCGNTRNKDDVTIAVAGMIYQDSDPELKEVPDLEGYHQKESV